MKTFKTTFYLFVALCCFAFTSRAQQKGVTLDFDNYEANIKVLTNYVAALKAGDAATLNSYFNDNAMILGLGNSLDTISKKEHLERYTATFKEHSFEIKSDVYLSVKTDKDAAVTPGEYAFGWGVVRSTNKESKKTAMVPYHVVALIVDGKISFLAHYYDVSPFMLQAGYTFTPPK